MLDIATPTANVKPDDEHSDGNNVRTWTFFVDKINGVWRKGAGNFIACGQYLIEAKEELERGAFNVMVKDKLSFDESVATKLRKIAANHLLCAHVHNLPPCWSTLYELSQLKPEILQAAFADGTTIHPGMQRKDAIALKPKRKSKSTSSTSEVLPPNLYTAWDSASADQRCEFLDKLGRDGICQAMSTELQAKFSGWHHWYYDCRRLDILFLGYQRDRQAPFRDRNCRTARARR